MVIAAVTAGNMPVQWRNNIGSQGIRWKINIEVLLVPLSSRYLLPRCQQRSLSLDLLTLCSPAVHKCFRRRSLLIAADNNPTPPSSRPSCSLCLNVIWQTKRLFIQSRNKTQHPPFTLRLSNTPASAAIFSESWLSRFFLWLSGAENFSPQIKEGIIANMAEIPTLIPILCVCVCVHVCECKRVWFVCGCYEKAHCGCASVPN